MEKTCLALLAVLAVTALAAPVEAHISHSESGGCSSTQVHWHMQHPGIAGCTSVPVNLPDVLP